MKLMPPQTRLDWPTGKLALVFPFMVEVDSVEFTAKLHQGLLLADRLSVAEHLAKSRRDDVRAVAAKMYQDLQRAEQR